MSQYSRQIEVGQNLVFFNPENQDHIINIDCSVLAEQNIAFVCEENGIMWIEHKPFDGRVYEFDKEQIESLFTAAQEAWAIKNDYEMSLIDVTPVIGSYNGFLVLDKMGYSSAFEEWIRAEERTFLQKTYFNHSLLWKRSDEVLLDAMTAIGLDEQKLDDLFELAGSM